MIDYTNFNFDADGDGVMDSIAELQDLNGDGVADALLVDVGGDGSLDMYMLDTDQNGIFDLMHMSLDTNDDGFTDLEAEYHDYDQDGFMESGSVYQDMDGDRAFDLVIRELDTDDDGVMDRVTTIMDDDGDGVADATMEEQLLDTDGDEIPDTYVVQSDYDGDQVFDAVDVYDYDPQSGVVDLIYQEDIGGGYIQEQENFDPDAADPEDICGNPAASMEEWEYQGDTGRCALYSQKFVIQELTGREVDIEEMADFAEQNNWFSEEGGTPLLHMNKMLNAYGVDNEMTFHNDIENLRQCLENGGKVIVSVDADEIWYGETDQMFVPVDGANHAVQVIGIDDSDPDNPMVILNDSGTPDGCGEMVPLDVFEDAWADGDCQMIACF